MEKRAEPEMFCCVCRAPVTENDIEKGAAVIRYGEVYCLEHYNQKFPDECINHPGRKVTIQCTHCGRWGCSDCIVELAGKKVCLHCKPAVVGEFITGRPAARIVRRAFKPLMVGRDIIRKLVTRRRQRAMDEWFSHDDSGDRTRPFDEWVKKGKLHAALDVLSLGVVSLLIPVTSLVAVPKYLAYRRDVSTGTALKSPMAGVGIVLALIAPVLWLLGILYFSGVFDQPSALYRKKRTSPPVTWYPQQSEERQEPAEEKKPKPPGRFVAISAFKNISVEEVTSQILEYAEKYGVSCEILGKVDPDKAVNRTDAFVYAPKNGWTVVLWPRYFTLHDIETCRALSVEMSAIVSTVHIYDSDYWVHVLFNRGSVIDRFASIPDYFAQSEEEAAGLKVKYAGSPGKLAAALSVTEELVAPYLVHIEPLDTRSHGRAFPDDVFELPNAWVFTDFWRRLGITHPENLNDFEECIRFMPYSSFKLPTGDSEL